MRQDFKRGWQHQLSDQSIDLVYSFAVVQHVTDRVFMDSLKPGGTLLFHIALNEGASETAWARDKGLRGMIKWTYGLNFFLRTEQQANQLVDSSGFHSVRVLSLKQVCDDDPDDVFQEHLIVAAK